MSFSLINKNILYIAPKFFGYEKIIKKNLEILGANVDYFDDRPSNDFWTKVFIRLELNFFVNKKISSYYENIINLIKNQEYDYIFLISPEAMPYKKLSTIVKLQPNAKKILYMWDSFKNKNSLGIVDLFDKVFSFDNNDTEQYGLLFLPLFYIEEYKKIKTKSYEYDVTFIATAHSDRYKIAKQVYDLLKGYKIYYYLYLPNRLIYFIRRYFVRSYKYGRIRDFKFKSLSNDEVVQLIGKSKIILDINHPNQCGLTMRTFECLGARKKMITTNQNILKYDFFDKSNIFIINRNNIKVDKDFFNWPYKELKKSVYDKYSIENWLKTIFQ